MRIRPQLNYSKKDNATFDQRAAAFIIDTVLLTTVLSFITSDGALITALSTSYFIFFQSLYGYTLGKYLLGLRVLVEENESREKAILLRETIGKFLSALFLLFGYLKVLFGERLALHDQISKTRVISIKPVVSKPLVVIGKSLLNMAVMFALFTGYGFYKLSYTSHPLKLAAHALMLKGVEIEGVSGSKVSGYKIKRLRVEDGLRIFEASRISIAPGATIRTRKGALAVFIDRVNIENLTISFRKGLVRDTESSDQETNPWLSLLPKEPYVYNSVALDGFKLKKSSFSVKKASLPSQHHKVSLEELFIDSASKRLSFKFNTVVNTSSPRIENLKKPLKITGRLKVDDSNGAKIHLAAFDDSVSLIFDGENSVFKVSNFKPQSYFKISSAIKQISLELDTKNLSGRFKLRNKKFYIAKHEFLKKGGFVSARPMRGDTLLFISLPHLLMDSPWLKIKSNGLIRSVNPDTLAQLYFGRSVKAVNKKYKKILWKDYEFFKRNPFEKSRAYLKNNMFNFAKARNRFQPGAKIRQPSSKKEENTFLLKPAKGVKKEDLDFLYD